MYRSPLEANRSPSRNLVRSIQANAKDFRRLQSLAYGNNAVATVTSQGSFMGKLGPLALCRASLASWLDSRPSDRAKRRAMIEAIRKIRAIAPSA